jgi:TetR/AcrR family transcriptional regulator, regulator of autoinduction and epiphytic fitness
VSAVPASVPAPVARKSFRETQFTIREEAIVEATNRLLASKGYESMSMDDIAAEVGIAKGSLYRHFDSKESLAGAVMVRLLQRTRAALDGLPADLQAGARLEALLRWTLAERLAGGVPHLPSASPSLRDALLANRAYMDELMELSDAVGALIQQAKKDGSLRADLRDEFVLYTLYARSCDPTLDFLKATGSMTDAEIVDQMVSACLQGIGARRMP